MRTGHIFIHLILTFVWLKFLPLMEKHFIVSARKYRPESFETVVGQPSVTRTLKNAITGRQLAHAYLFTGPRGVGKTTCARIFAKTINCTQLTDDSEACGQCAACLSFQENRSFNIHELDAASNNHVEDIKNLIDQVRIPPQTGKYSVYIIDEVHMLSQAAFNAFLKTLEEPPAHAIFILATTEKHKILPTILSRCQVFDFHRIQVKDIIFQLETIASREVINAENAALNIIAQKADGSMRDALSIFDQVVSFCGNNITYQQVIEHLNVLDYEYYFRLTGVFMSGDYRQALLIYDDILEQGFDPGNFVSGLASHFRDLLVSKDPETIQLLEVGGEIAGRYQRISATCSVNFIYEALKILGDCEVNLRQTKDPRLHVELTLLSLTRILNSFDNQPATLGAGSADQKPVISRAAPTGATPPQPPVSAPVSAPAAAPPPEAAQTTASAPGSATPSSGIGKITRINEFLAKKSNGTGPNPAQQVASGNKPAVLIDMTTETIKKLWLEFAAQIKDDQPRLYNTMITQLPELDQQNKVVLTLNNPLQEKAIRSIQSDLNHFLRENTGRDDIEIMTLVPDQPTEKKLYTPEEKYNYLQKKNPELDLFRQSLNLDLE